MNFALLSLTEQPQIVENKEQKCLQLLNARWQHTEHLGLTLRPQSRGILYADVITMVTATVVRRKK